MKKLLFLGACLVALASQPVMAQTGGADVVVVNVYYTGLGTGHLGLTRASGTTDVAQFKNTSAARKEEAAAYQQLFAQLYQEGYSLKSTLVRAENLCTWIFARGQ
jgi:hypothetical protein